MIFYGVAMIIRLTNVHVVIGVITTYGTLCLVLKFAMEVLSGTTCLTLLVSHMCSSKVAHDAAN